jgi:hypothetical protein
MGIDLESRLEQSIVSTESLPDEEQKALLLDEVRITKERLHELNQMVLHGLRSPFSDVRTATVLNLGDLSMALPEFAHVFISRIVSRTLDWPVDDAVYVELGADVARIMPLLHRSMPERVFPIYRALFLTDDTITLARAEHAFKQLLAEFAERSERDELDIPKYTFDDLLGLCRCGTTEELNDEMRKYHNHFLCVRKRFVREPNWLGSVIDYLEKIEDNTLEDWPEKFSFRSITPIRKENDMQARTAGDSAYSFFAPLMRCFSRREGALKETETKKHWRKAEQILRNLAQLAVTNPELFGKLYQLAAHEIGSSDPSKQFSDTRFAFVRLLPSFACPINPALADFTDDEKCAKLAHYLDSRYAHAGNDAAKPLKPTESLVQEARMIIQHENTSSSDISVHLARGLNDTLDEAVECASVRLPGESEVHKKLGKGASGVVYLANHSIEGDLKVKIYRPLALSKIAKAREQEGITALDSVRRMIEIVRKRLSSARHIVKYYSTGRCTFPGTGEPTVFVTGEYIDGGSIEHQTSPGVYAIREDIRPAEVMIIFDRILCGLAEIHEQELLLKDVKLGNVLLSKDHKRVVIDDLETLAGMEEVRKGTRPTEGSDRYAAPEVLQDIRAASKGSDLYSATACLLYMLTREHNLIGQLNIVFSQKEYDARLKRILEKVRSLQVGEQVVDALRIGLSFNPKYRFSNAQTFRDILIGT